MSFERAPTILNICSRLAWIGLLLLRVTAGIALADNGVGMLHGVFGVEGILLYLASTIGELFLILGLWTSIAGTFVVIIEIWKIISQDGDRWMLAFSVGSVLTSEARRVDFSPTLLWIVH